MPFVSGPKITLPYIWHHLAYGFHVGKYTVRPMDPMGYKSCCLIVKGFPASTSAGTGAACALPEGFWGTGR